MIPGTTRRAALASAAAALAPAPALATAQSAPRGPAVWQGMDQAALDAAYDQSAYAPNIAQVVRRYALESERARRTLGAPRRLAYGAREVEGFDLYPTAAPNAPVLVFVHGGAWRSGAARDSAYMAECVTRAGAHLAVPDFWKTGDTGGDLLPIAEQIRAAVAWVADNAASFGGDPSRVFLAGHSSGAHMAAVALTTDWAARGRSPDMIKGGLLVSGLYDLRGARLSARSRYVRFTDEAEEALSPQRHLRHLRAPVTVAWGTLETPEFQRMPREFAAAIAAAGKPAATVEAEAFNHFELVETLANPYGLMGRAALAMMRLGTG